MKCTQPVLMTADYAVIIPVARGCIGGGGGWGQHRTSEYAEKLCAPLDGDAAELLVLVLDDEGPEE
jgi:hypothetical protein